MKRTLFVLVVVCILLGIVAGCDRTKAVDPALHFSRYSQLTELFGTERMATPEALGFDLQQVENISDSRWGFPITEEYAGLEFDISTMFSGADYHFAGVYMERAYAYPEEKDELIFDTVTVCQRLCADFGPATDSSYFFNWVEVMLGEQWNEDVKFWQDAWVMERVVDAEYGGTLLWWDITSVATPAVMNELESLGSDAVHALVCSMHIDAYNGSAVLTIAY